MSNHSVIEHRANYHFVKVEEDYLAICSKGKHSPHCKALILAILEHWTNHKREKGESEYIYITMPQWIQFTYMLYERNVITDCLRELLEDGLIERRSIVMYDQKTFEYALCIQRVQTRIRELPVKAREDYLPNLTNYLAFKQRAKEERDAKKEKRVGEKSRTVREKTITPQKGSEKSHTVGEKSPTEYVKNQRNIDSITDLPDIDSDRESVSAPPTSETPAHEDTHTSFSNSSSQQKDKSQVNTTKKARWELLLDYWDSKYGPGPRSKWVENEAKDMIERMKPTPEQVDKVCAELKARKKPITFENMYNNWHLLKEVEEREKAQATPSTSSSIRGYTDYTHVKPTRPIRPMPRAERNAPPPTQKESPR